MATILGTNQTSKCIYCGSASYGTGCAYSAHHKHVHNDDPKRCVYCGSQSFGVGCPYNPFDHKHVHGVAYNMMYKESAHTSFSAGIFLTRLTQKITTTPAFKLGIIDEEGKKIKEPETLEEKASFTPLDSYIFKLRRLLGEDKLALLNSIVIVEKLSSVNSEDFDLKQYEANVKMKRQIKRLVEDYKNILDESILSGLTPANAENALIEEVLKLNEK